MIGLLRELERAFTASAKGLMPKAEFVWAGSNRAGTPAPRDVSYTAGKGHLEAWDNNGTELKV